MNTSEIKRVFWGQDHLALYGNEDLCLIRIDSTFSADYIYQDIPKGSPSDSILTKIFAKDGRVTERYWDSHKIAQWREIRKADPLPSIYDIFEKHIAWSLTTFGAGDNTEGLCKHIEKELNEIRANPKDVIEWIDVIILAFDGCWRLGYSPQEIIERMNDKIELNRNRRWQVENFQTGKPIEHLRE
jgi:hypothetical protein